MKPKHLLKGAALALCGLAIGCARTPSDAESGLPLTEFMGHVMQRNAEQLWAWTAIEIDKTGEHSGKPTSDEAWAEAESDALTLHELTFTLEHSTSRIDDPRWGTQLASLRKATAASAQAAERKDFAALSKAGEAINHECVACHLVFAPQLETRPPAVPLPRP